MPAWLFMWLLAFAIFGGCKWLTWWHTPMAAPWHRHLGYLLAWPGLDARAFLSREPYVSRPTFGEWLRALVHMVLGGILFWGVARLIPERWPILAGWVGMTGMILLLHFGSFHLLSCGWRSVGVNAQPLMNRPLRSTSLSEFWGQRWNTAFRDLTHRFLFRPLGRWLGPRRALLAGFLCSGLVHDLVISVPARGGYGGPTLFFLIQALGLLVERSLRARWSWFGQGWAGWLFTALTLVLPAGLLFHPPFIERVVLPFMTDLGARPPAVVEVP